MVDEGTDKQRRHAVCRDGVLRPVFSFFGSQNDVE